MRVPEPTHCPFCRLQRRMAFRNDSCYYKNTCYLCQKSVISIYSPDKPYPIVCPECFWSDNFDPLQYSQDFDFSRTFFHQYEEMRSKVPRIAIFNTKSENCDFTVHATQNKNCYQCSSMMGCEDCYYSDWIDKSTDSMDCLLCTEIEFCYACIDCNKCHSCNFCEKCINLTDSVYCFDCRSSKRLVGCIGLRNRKNHILNQPASKDECLATIKKLKTNHEFRTKFKQKFEQLKLQVAKPTTWGINNENCTGNGISDCKNSSQSFFGNHLEDCRYTYDCLDAQNIYDCLRGGINTEMVYESHGFVELKYAKACNLCYHCDNIAYSDNCQNSSYCFGSISLKRNKFCILNKQYTETQYKELIPKIIEHMKKTEEYGEFFPIQMSSFGYNETKANDYFQITRDKAHQKNYKWCDYESKIPDNLEIIDSQTIPYDINEVQDDITQKGIQCEITGKPFKINSHELKFYKKKGLSIPKRSPKQRHLTRIAKLGGYGTYLRTCDNCQKQVESAYSQDFPGLVYCESCYMHTIY